MVLCEFQPFTRLERVEARQRGTGFRVSRQSPEELHTVCREVAADLGLAVVDDDPDILHLRDPFLLRAFPVEVVVKSQGDYGDIQVQVVGYAGAGVVAQTQYLERLIQALAERVQRGGRFSERAFETAERKRRRRMMLRYLRVVQWVPLSLLLPLIVVTQIYMDGLKPMAVLVAWCYLVVAAPLVASCFRRRVAGVGSAFDLAPLAAATGVFAVGVVLWLVFALS
jgi:hypothetical protein